MKLSRRGKRTKHARRGKHTKRTGKHHTRRIKHRGKQYKRTYRKNNRKLKHNKRIQRGGLIVNWTPNNTGNIYNASNVQLTYKKRGKLMNDDNPFDIKLEYKSLVKDVASFTVTMTRKTKPSKEFVVYFKLYFFKLYFSKDNPDFEIVISNNDNVFCEIPNFSLTCSKELSELRNRLNISVSELYTFPLNTMNKDFFESLADKMRKIAELANDRKITVPTE